MKKIVYVLILSLLLTGCASEIYETVGNVIHVGEDLKQPRKILLDFPQEAAVLTAAGTDALYQCDGYTLSVQQMASGDLTASIRSLCGYDLADLTILETVCADHARYDWVWVAAGEQGDVLCRGALLDDGNMHYSLCVSADAQEAGELSQVWNGLFASFCLEQPQSD